MFNTSNALRRSHIDTLDDLMKVYEVRKLLHLKNLEKNDEIITVIQCYSIFTDFSQTLIYTGTRQKTGCYLNPFSIMKNSTQKHSKHNASKCLICWFYERYDLCSILSSPVP